MFLLCNNKVTREEVRDDDTEVRSIFNKAN